MISKKRIIELLKYYKEFREEVWLLQKKYEEMKELREAQLKIQGKIELLEELLDKYNNEESLREKFWKIAEEMYNDEYVAKMRGMEINAVLEQIERLM